MKQKFWGRGRSAVVLLVLLLLAGLAVRIPFLSTDWRVSNDLETQRRWMMQLARGNLITLYDGRAQLYPPLILYAQSGAVRFAFTDDRALNFFLKLPAVLADVGTALLIAFALWRHRRVALAAAALYLYNPAIFYVSTFWGQVDSIYTFFLVMSLGLLGRRHEAAWSAFAFALGSKLQAGVFAPILVIGTVRQKGIRRLAWGAALAVMTLGIILLPWIIEGKLDRHFLDSISFASRTPRVDVSGYNFWYLVLGGNVHGVSSLGSFLFLRIREIGFFLYGGYMLFLVFRLWRSSQQPLALAAALASFALFLFAPEVHERYLFPTLAFLILAAAQAQSHARLHRLARVYWLGYIILSVTFFFNLVTVAQPFFIPSFNLITASNISLTLIALGVACLNLVVFAILTACFWQQERSEYALG